MKILSVSILFALLAVPSGGYSFDSAALPDSLGSDPVLARSAEIQTWKPKHMFEHVNGEAELLIRYGAVSLTFVSYEHESGDYLSVDLLDLGEPINAYGLYRLYTGCDGEEQNVPWRGLGERIWKIRKRRTPPLDGLANPVCPMFTVCGTKVLDQGAKYMSAGNSMHKIA